MNAQSFYKLINNPALLNAETLAELEDIKEAYPYVENIRILYALNLLVLEDFKYQENLTKAAFYASDRKKLKQLVERMQGDIEEDFSLISKTEETATAIAKDEPITEDFKKEEKPKKEKEQKTAIEQARSKIEENQAQEITKEKKLHKAESDNKEEQYIQQERKIKQLRSKAELLRLVKQRLKEIEEAKNTGEVIKDDIKEDKNISSNLIDKFISSQPSISRPNKTEFYDPQKEAIESTIDDDDFFVTETLASIHADQGNNTKAAKIYQKLILKFPEKSSYFAARIQDLSKK